jgi:F420-non-reducing hydrogenase iron-sulfur subunit
MAKFEPIIVAFACHYCAYTAADNAGSMRLEYPANVKIIKLPCTGKLDSLHVMNALQKGADGVLVAGCMVGDCHFERGNIRASKKVQYVKSELEAIGIEPERVEMVYMSAGQGRKFARSATEFTEKVRALGPSPIKEGADKTAA